MDMNFSLSTELLFCIHYQIHMTRYQTGKMAETAQSSRIYYKTF